jgi:hypothetical protein
VQALSDRTLSIGGTGFSQCDSVDKGIDRTMIEGDRPHIGVVFSPDTFTRREARFRRYEWLNYLRCCRAANRSATVAPCNRSGSRRHCRGDVRIFFGGLRAAQRLGLHVEGSGAIAGRLRRPGHRVEGDVDTAATATA